MAEQQAQRGQLCGWFWAMNGPDRAVFLTRFSWLTATAITFIGLLPAGWQLVKVSQPVSRAVCRTRTCLWAPMNLNEPQRWLRSSYPTAPSNHNHSSITQYAAAGTAVTAHYGLWKIDFYGQSNYVSNYLDWSAAQPEESSAYAQIQVRVYVCDGQVWVLTDTRRPRG